MEKNMGLGGCQSGSGQGMMDIRMRETDPKKYEEISKLRKQLMEATKDLMEKSRKDDEDLKKLADKYRETKADADKAALKAKLEERIKNGIESQKQRLSEDEKNIQSNVERMLKDMSQEKPAGKDKVEEKPATR